MLAAAAFTDVNVVAHDQAVTCGDLEETLNVLLAVGPLGRIVREAPERRAAAQAHVRQVLVERGDPARVSLAAAVWVVTAKAP